MTKIDPKPYHRQEGEPNRWYDRFHRFCLLGPSRSLLQCYRSVMSGRAALVERGPLAAIGQADVFRSDWPAILMPQEPGQGFQKLCITLRCIVYAY